MDSFNKKGSHVTPPPGTNCSEVNLPLFLNGNKEPTKSDRNPKIRATRLNPFLKSLSDARVQHSVI